MSTPYQPRLTIGQVMGLIAAFAVAWVVVGTPGAIRFLIWAAVPLTLMIGGPIAIYRHMSEGSAGVRCPGCGGFSLGRRAVSSFGYRYYRCDACGLRCRRRSLGLFWEDASAPGFDAIYRKKADDDPWSAPPGLEDEDVAYSKTHANLVRNKRLRKPDNPNGPGLE